MIYYVLAGWLLLAIVCEVYIIKSLKDSDGTTSWPDDDSIAMTKKYAEHGNEKRRVERRSIRVTYLAVPALVAFFIFLM